MASPAPFGYLTGRWSGSGTGIYPTIEDFAYDETIEFSDVGRPFVVYRQTTTRAGTGEPLHAESGYLRPGPGAGGVEWIIAQPTGIAEVLIGTHRDGVLDVTSHRIALTPTAKRVESVRRHLRVDGDRLSYQLDMAAVGRSEQIHLTAQLRRIS